MVLALYLLIYVYKQRRSRINQGYISAYCVTCFPSYRGCESICYFVSLIVIQAGRDGLVNDSAAVHFIVDTVGWLCYFLYQILILRKTQYPCQL